MAVSAALAAGALIPGCSSDAPSAPDDPSVGVSAPAMPSTPLTREQEEELAAEHDDKVRACLEDEGFRTVDGKDGAGWEVDQGGLDDETFEGVLTMCNERVGWVTFAPVTSEEASGMYDLTLG